MKFRKIFAVALMLICIALTCVACKDDDETPVGEETTTAAAEETETRFDYFAIENFDEYVSVDKSAYENMKIELEDKYSISDEQIDEYIEYLLFNKKTVKNNGAKVTQEAIKRGDMAYIFYRGVMLDENGEEQEFDGGSNMTDTSPYALSIGSGSFIDGFEDGLIGVVPSETGPENMIKLDLKFPEDYDETTLAGKDVSFYVYVSWIVQYEIPEYNEAFITETLQYVPETDDAVTEHKAYIRNMLEESFESSRLQDIESKIWEALYAGTTVIALPESEVEYFYNAYCEDLEEGMAYYNYLYGYGFSDVEVFARWYYGLDSDGDWRAEVRAQAEKAVTQTLIYHAVAEACGIVVTDLEFETVIEKYIELYKEAGKEYTRDEVLAALGEVAIREGTLYEKVVDHIKTNATITYVPVEE